MALRSQKPAARLCQAWSCAWSASGLPRCAVAERVFRIHEEAGIRAAFLAAWNIAREMLGKAKHGLEIVVRPMKDKRSVAQNRRYWLMLRELASIAWIEGRQFTDQTWHEHFKRQFIGCEELAMPDGKTELRGISTTKLSVEEFGEYMVQIEAWAAEQGWPLMAGEWRAAA